MSGLHPMIPEFFSPERPALIFLRRTKQGAFRASEDCHLVGNPTHLCRTPTPMVGIMCRRQSPDRPVCIEGPDHAPPWFVIGTIALSPPQGDIVGVALRQKTGRNESCHRWSPAPKSKQPAGCCVGVFQIWPSALVWMSPPSRISSVPQCCRSSGFGTWGSFKRHSKRWAWSSLTRSGSIFGRRTGIGSVALRPRLLDWPASSTFKPHQVAATCRPRTEARLQRLGDARGIDNSRPSKLQAIADGL